MLTYSVFCSSLGGNLSLYQIVHSSIESNIWIRINPGLFNGKQIDYMYSFKLHSFVWAMKNQVLALTWWYVFFHASEKKPYQTYWYIPWTKFHKLNFNNLLDRNLPQLEKCSLIKHTWIVRMLKRYNCWFCLTKEFC